MTAKERYKEHSKKLKEYENDFYKLVESLDITESSKLRLETLFYNFGYTTRLNVKEYISQQIIKTNKTI